MLEVEFTPKL